MRATWPARSITAMAPNVENLATYTRASTMEMSARAGCQRDQARRLHPTHQAVHGHVLRNGAHHDCGARRSQFVHDLRAHDLSCSNIHAFQAHGNERHDGAMIRRLERVAAAVVQGGARGSCAVSWVQALRCTDQGSQRTHDSSSPDILFCSRTFVEDSVRPGGAAELVARVPRIREEVILVGRTEPKTTLVETAENLEQRYCGVNLDS